MNFIFYIEICLCQQIVKRVESNNSIARSILYGYFTSNSLLRMARFMNAQRWSDMSNQFWALNHPTLKWKTSLACRRRRGNMLVLKNWLWTFFCRSVRCTQCSATSAAKNQFRSSKDMWQHYKHSFERIWTNDYHAQHRKATAWLLNVKQGFRSVSACSNLKGCLIVTFFQI